MWWSVEHLYRAEIQSSVSCRQSLHPLHPQWLLCGHLKAGSQLCHYIIILPGGHQKEYQSSINQRVLIRILSQDKRSTLHWTFASTQLVCSLDHNFPICLYLYPLGAWRGFEGCHKSTGKLLLDTHLSLSMPPTNWILKTKHLLSPTCFWPWWTESFLPDSSNSSLRGLGSGRFVLIFVILFSQNQTLSLWGGLSLWRVGQASSSPCLAPAPCHLHIRVPVLLPEQPQLGIAIIGDLDLLQKSVEILLSKLRNFQQLPFRRMLFLSSSRYKITNDSPYTGISASPYSQ